MSHRILVIDDKPDTVEAMQCALELSGHDVEVAYDGHGGIAKALAVRPEVILCDIGLPGGADGYRVAETLRSSEQCASSYMLAITGCVEADDVKRAVAAGFDLHISKPVDIQVVLRLISERFEEDEP
ncbi:MAG TPA: response regulator [Longimicrobiales bacterium]|nr:response regulator [Longimicrobiales bacterium]